MHDFLEKFDRTIIFFLIYSIIFFLFFNTLGYTLPFVLALIFALLLKRPTRYLSKKLKLKNSVSALICTIIFYTILFIIITLLITSIISELTTFSKNITNYVITLDNRSILNMLDNFKSYYNKLDPTIISAVEDNLNDISSKMIKYASDLGSRTISSIINFITSFLSSIPYLVMLFVFTLIATYFFTRDISGANNTEKFNSAFNKNASKLMYIYDETKRMLLGYSFSYLIVVSITFVITLTGFIILRINYAFVLSFLCAILDLMPVVGMPMVFIPLVIFYIAKHEIILAIGLAILYALVFITRQIVEPKVVSSSLGIHPVAVLAAFFIGLKINGVMGMLYCIFLVVFYNIFKKVNVI